MARSEPKEETPLRNHYEPEYQVIVMGETGGGKSTFINQLLGITDMKVGTTLSSCTHEIQAANIRLPSGRFASFVDTPGFDDHDVNWSDPKVLTLICLWLAEVHQKKPIAAIIYVHQINRPGLLHERTWRIIKEICGMHAFGHLIFVTTKWDKVTGDRQVYEDTEGELKERFLLPLHGWSEATNYFRCIRGESQNSKSILQRIDTLSGAPLKELKIQREINARKNRKLHRTTAGKLARVQQPTWWEEFLEFLLEKLKLA